MFTGIIEELGTVVGWPARRLARLAVHGDTVTADARHGDSIAVNGVCLTVVEVDGGVFTADVMQETLRPLGARAAVRRRPGQPGTRRDPRHPARRPSRPGPCRRRRHHHSADRPAEHWEAVRFTLPDGLDRYVVEKGSITVDGISLTVTAVGRRTSRSA